MIDLDKPILFVPDTIYIMITPDFKHAEYEAFLLFESHGEMSSKREGTSKSSRRRRKNPKKAKKGLLLDRSEIMEKPPAVGENTAWASEDRMSLRELAGLLNMQLSDAIDQGLFTPPNDE
jgi:hypothetical protein